MKSKIIKFVVFLLPITLLGIAIVLIIKNNATTPKDVEAQTENPWVTAGGNPQRTSWTAEQVTGNLVPDWYKIFKGAYILPRTQVVAANNTLFIATSRGLYAIDPATGAQKWVYATELPLADTPTYANGVVYIGGFDRKMHAIDATNGSRKWTYTAESGFQVSPLVVNSTVYAGNRDGYFYALDAGSGALKWRFKTGGPIVYSAAASTDNATIYFASNDMSAYALNASSGAQVWKSAKLPGDGFHSWWPVVAGNYVVFSGGENYRKVGPGEFGSLSNDIEKNDIWTGSGYAENTTTVGPTATGQTWAHGKAVLDYSKSNGNTSVSNYFESKPYRRTYFVLDRSSGVEKTYDFDGDGAKEYAPILWLGSYGGNRYPPIYDGRTSEGNGKGVLYQSNPVWYHSFSPRGQVTGWLPDSQYISLPTTSDKNASDEPQGYSMGGNVIYWVRCCDRVGKAFDITSSSEYKYFGESLHTIIPGYNSEYWNPESNFYSPHQSYQKNGSYGLHGDTVGPIPYKGRVYMVKSNALIAFGSAGSKTKAADATVTVVNNADAIPSKDALKLTLTAEIQKMVSKGHLRTGYLTTGILEQNQSLCGLPNLVDYFSQPMFTIYALTRALPYLSGTAKDQARSYIQSEYNAYPLSSITHVGWGSGARREVPDPPPDVASALTGGTASGTLHPFAFYALWKYAQEFGNASSLFSSVSSKFPTKDSDAELNETAFKLNAYIAGYKGYVELAKLAGQPASSYQSYETELNRLMSMRASNFSKDSPWQNDYFFSGRGHGYCRDLNIMRNFMYMTPELGDYLNANAKSKVQAAVDEFESIAPYWFVSKLEVSFAEGVLRHLYDYPSMFAAKAMILKEPYSELAKYIDVGAFDTGDVFYIQNLVLAIESSGSGPTSPPSGSPTPTPPPNPADANGDGAIDGADFVVWLKNYGQGLSGRTNGDFNTSGSVEIGDFTVWISNFRI